MSREVYLRRRSIRNLVEKVDMRALGDTRSARISTEDECRSKFQGTCPDHRSASGSQRSGIAQMVALAVEGQVTVDRMRLSGTGLPHLSAAEQASAGHACN